MAAEVVFVPTADGYDAWIGDEFVGAVRAAIGKESGSCTATCQRSGRSIAGVSQAAACAFIVDEVGRRRAPAGVPADAPADAPSDSLVILKSREGFRVLVGEELLGIVYAPLRGDPADYWCKGLQTGRTHKGLTQLGAFGLLRQEFERRSTRPQGHATAARPQVGTGEAPAGARASWLALLGQSVPASGAGPGPVRPSRPRVSPASERRRSDRAQAPSKKLIPCAVCGAPIRHVTRHYAKVHPEQQGRAATQQLERAQQASGTPDAVRPARRPPRTAPVQPSASPRWFGIRPARQWTTNDLTWVECPLCWGEILERAFGNHLQKRHPDWISQTTRASKAKKADRNSKRSAKAPARPTRTRRPKQATRWRLAGPGPQIGEDMLDATRGHGAVYRERGRFGSHASHDGYDSDGRL